MWHVHRRTDDRHDCDSPNGGGFACPHSSCSGSAATGYKYGHSDIDLLVVEDEVDDVRAESVRLRTVLGDLGHPVDVLVIRSDRFDKTKDLIGGIAYPANRYGIVLYEAA